ncbi:TPA: 50S ribosomal protein L33 [Enterococcus faecium]|nr:50S ribosomal protein L33 [Enterococcus faecium]HAQ2297258.1 50S ribosomal protein L33 [Enterococcus faecium]HAQ3978780.1 50S ribosomal protein L33 [Enterococcus faecium]
MKYKSDSQQGGRSKWQRKKAALACSVCGSRNYTKSVSEGKSGERLEINKFCKYCNQYTLHKETK